MEETNAFVEVATSAEEAIIKQTSTFVNWIKSFCTWENLFKLIGVIIILAIFFIIYKLLIRATKKIPAERTNPHRQMIITRAIKYIFYVLVVMYVLGLFGIKLSAIWGAAGIAGIAIGFAAQTSISNMISGLFILTEGTLKVGDAITVDGITGIVDSINLMSIQLHTYDNEMIRIPNSTIINTDLVNKSFHSKKRFTLTYSISYDTDMRKALETLSKAPELCPTVLKEPAPAVWFDNFGDSGIDLTVAVWFKPEDFIQTKNDLYIAVKKVFDDAGIDVPYNQLDINIKKPFNELDVNLKK